MVSEFLKFLIAGFVMSWGPCFSCTSFLLLPYIGGTKIDWQSGLKISLGFSIAKIAGLTILAGITAGFFRIINQFFTPRISTTLYLILAMFMIILGVLIILDKGFKNPICKNLLKRSIGSIFIAGFIVGIIPCLPLMTILTYIAFVCENNILLGALYGVFLGIGGAFTPIILSLVISLLPSKVLIVGQGFSLAKKEKVIKIFQLVCGIALIIFGGHFLLKLYGVQ